MFTEQDIYLQEDIVWHSGCLKQEASNRLHNFRGVSGRHCHTHSSFLRSLMIKLPPHGMPIICKSENVLRYDLMKHFHISYAKFHENVTEPWHTSNKRVVCLFCTSTDNISSFLLTFWPTVNWLVCFCTFNAYSTASCIVTKYWCGWM